MSAVEEERANPFAVAKTETPSKGMLEVAASRQAQEVQAAMVIAKKFPRDEIAAYERIMRACKRKDLAANAVYAYPRGGTTVEGPSIHLARVLAQQWGNIDFGIIELEQRYQESTVMAYAWDLETNARETKVFSVPHKRYTREGMKILTDPRDIYETVANNGARRLRSCILGVIPGDIVDAAVNACGQTLEHDVGKMPLEDRRREVVVLFADIGVTKDMLEIRLGHKMDTTTAHEIVNLGKIYRAITDNLAPIEEYFQRPGADGQPQTLKDKMAAKLNKGKNGKPETPPASAPSTPESAESANEFTQAYATLNLNYNDHSREIEKLLFKHGAERGLPEMRDTTDAKEIVAVIKTAKEFNPGTGKG